MIEMREIRKEDLPELLMLYTYIHGEAAPDIDGRVNGVWNELLSQRHLHIIAGCVDKKIVSSCVLNIVPNLTHAQRPYAWIENVVTHEAHRGKGYATAVLDYAKQLAQKENCYKIMLMTGAKDDKTFHFYEHAGYNRRDKTAFIQWL